MLRRIALIVLLSLSANANNLKVDEDGIIELNSHNIITDKIKFNTNVSYSFYFDDIESLGNFLIYEENRSGKKCYIPVLHKHNAYQVSEITCFELEIPMNESEPYWYAIHIKLDKANDINEINIKKIIDNPNTLDSSVSYVDGLLSNDNQNIVFEKLPLKNSMLDVISMKHEFKVVKRNGLIDLNFQNLIIPNYKKLNGKEYLYNTPSTDSKTKMYLIKGDQVQILEEQTDKEGNVWVHILFKGKKEIRKWIPKSALGLAQ